ncbi:hypothetical protein DFS34DRAFT_635593 [Phlyctochytrium arcticum]|nr:hypothetical protein DFS34DRAFT_635593 [Phlyctochytrium arcticum]
MTFQQMPHSTSPPPPPNTVKTKTMAAEHHGKLRGTSDLPGRSQSSTSLSSMKKHWSATTSSSTSSLSTLSSTQNSTARRRRHTIRNRPPSDLLPGFEQKFGVSSASVLAAGKAQSFALQDGLAFIGYAAGAIAQDEFSKCFTQKPRRSFSPRTLFVGPLYWIGWVVRHFILFPYRLALLLLATLLFFIALPIVLHFDNEEWQRWLFKVYCKAFLLSWGSKIKYHGEKPKLNEPHIFVANHTSVIDYLVLSAHDFPHATVAQKHGGVIGYFEDRVLTLNGSLMFNRNEKNDRSVLAQKMRAHVHNVKNVPLLIFPEGTCVNNEYTVLFHKGAFDLDAAVAPVAIKYNKRWADAYWHSKTQTFTKHLMYLMTRWAMVADVWYLPPRSRKSGQSPVEFANEIKAEISAVAQLKNLSWDGYFKNYAPAAEKQVRLQQHPQTRYGVVLMNRMRNRPTPDRMSHLRRSASISSSPTRRIATDKDWSMSRPEWLDPTGSLSAKNAILAGLDDNALEMIEEISHRQHDVVKTWQRYSKMRSEDIIQRRIENSSWRLWFKQRIVQERERAMLASLSNPLAQWQPTTTPSPFSFSAPRSASPTVLSSYKIMSYFPPALFSPAADGNRPRSRSLGTSSAAYSKSNREQQRAASAREPGLGWKVGNAPMVPAR